MIFARRTLSTNLYIFSNAFRLLPIYFDYDNRRDFKIVCIIYTWKVSKRVWIPFWATIYIHIYIFCIRIWSHRCIEFVRTLIRIRIHRNYALSRATLDAMRRFRFLPLVNQDHVKSKFFIDGSTQNGVRRETVTRPYRNIRYVFVYMHIQQHMYVYVCASAFWCSLSFIRSSPATVCFRMKFIREEVCQFSAK